MNIHNLLPPLAVCDIGSASFKYDMRRLSEILAFPRAWYRRSIARRLFLGDQTINLPGDCSVDLVLYRSVGRALHKYGLFIPPRCLCQNKNCNCVTIVVHLSFYVASGSTMRCFLMLPTVLPFFSEMVHCCCFCDYFLSVHCWLLYGSSTATFLTSQVK